MERDNGCLFVISIRLFSLLSYLVAEQRIRSCNNFGSLTMDGFRIVRHVSMVVDTDCSVVRAQFLR